MRANPCSWIHALSYCGDGAWLWRPTCVESAPKPGHLVDENSFNFVDGRNPIENDFKYCPFCGGRIELAKKLNG